MRGHVYDVECMGADKARNFLVSATPSKEKQNGLIFLWDLRKEKSVIRYSCPLKKITHIAVHPEMEFIVAAGEGEILVWRVKDILEERDEGGPKQPKYKTFTKIPVKEKIHKLSIEEETVGENEFTIEIATQHVKFFTIPTNVPPQVRARGSSYK